MSIANDDAKRPTQWRAIASLPMDALAETARGLRFVVSFFALSPLASRRFVHAWDRDGPAAARAVYRAHSERALAIAGADVSVEGEHHIPAAGCVLIYNESSLLDLVLLQRYLYEHADAGVAAEVFARLPWARAAFARSGIEIFQRGDRAAAERMLATVTARVAKGARLAMGGEGRLTPGGGVGHFKRGACLVAIRAGVPIVPVALSGGPAMMALGSLRLRPGKLGVRYGAPLSTAGWSEAGAEQLAAQVRDAVVAMRGPAGQNKK
jgi:1-acyl-sn-glycerol-3-phosphate acyltransferase